MVAGQVLGPLGAAAGGELTAAAQADRLLASAVPDTGDDACLVVVRIR